VQPRTHSKSIAPSRWSLADGDSVEFIPLEFSCDPAVLSSCRRLKAQPLLTESLGTLLKRHGLDDILGIGVLSRDQLTAGPGEIYVEDSQREASVITARKRSDVDTGSLVETSWMLSAGETVTNAACFIYCYTWCIAREGYHEEPHTREHDAVRKHIPGERKIPSKGP
jgi:hypothetical protein